MLLYLQICVGDYGGSVDSLMEGMGMEIGLENIKVYP